ncbi:UDP-3-O-acyl-N-acetylglucosamine deacetylase [Ponticaulis sp.]|uniref:UDP-3-O-acyl-N-acetylglucosamine deacetylase n=1 Tax=Ponticaulis sp. TaxID=2020902 RepID=UPI000C5FDC66|nr:UDP-3-O-acyl-N-acetylglucosamine deacetylase [Ponticaulis sp.]MAJ08983.1 UDP-3-O-[3-hydroxymyristoyl] N-acetylglucosamine deacetylase [Ponticaulis sp.]RPG16778.1 MAG: UDP-3-O-acyl-N-acetylglucosamine deacetylase [Hyphomonadaceae bacterium TMED125]
MTSIEFQQTLASSAICAGIGVHSGERARLTLKPAPVGTGIRFHRVDVPEAQGWIDARGDLVHDVALGTKLRNEYGTTLSTVEHLLAAVYGLGIDNMIIEVDGPEVPIMDGSSSLYTDLILRTGIRQQARRARYIRILKRIEVQDGPKSAMLLPSDDNGFHLDATIDFDSEAIGRQRKSILLTPRSFARELAFARTFGFYRDIKKLHSMGLGQGASMENAIAVEDDKILNPEGLRVEDEFIRHKILDAVGDLALVGHRLIGRYVSEQPGHSINNLLVREVLNRPDAWEFDTLESESTDRAETALAHAL